MTILLNYPCCRFQPATRIPPTQPHRNSNTHRTKNNTTNVVIQQNSHKLLMMDILMSEICWAHKKWNKIASDNKLVFYSSTITMMHGPVNIRTKVVKPNSIFCDQFKYVRFFIRQGFFKCRAAEIWSKSVFTLYYIKHKHYLTSKSGRLSVIFACWMPLLTVQQYSVTMLEIHVPWCRLSMLEISWWNRSLCSSLTAPKFEREDA